MSAAALGVCPRPFQGKPRWSRLAERTFLRLDGAGAKKHVGRHRRSRENALRCAKRPMPEFKMQFVQWAKDFLRRSFEDQRNMAPWTWRGRLQSRRVTSRRGSDPAGPEHLGEANRHVAQSEQLVAGWRDVVDRMQAQGRDVTVARDLLETFEGNLEVHRRNRRSDRTDDRRTASIGPVSVELIASAIRPTGPRSWRSRLAPLRRKT